MERSIKLIIIILIALMVVVSIVGGILFFTTDLFKSKETLFKKYLAQELKNIAEISDVSDEEKNLDYIIYNDHTEKTDIKISYLENENDQEEFYNINIDGISNNSEKAYYKNIKTTYGSEVLSDIELLRQNETYGIRFSDLVQQFVSIENATMPYVMSNIGLEGNKYFQERMKLDNLKLSGLFDFSDEEIEKLKQTYFNVIFSDIDPKSYSSKSGVMITLYNEESLTTKQYTLNLTKNELDKIYKKILNQAMNDQILLSKLENIDNKISEMGFIEPEGESLKEQFILNLKKKHDDIEYLGQNNEKITINVYQSKGITYRISMKSEMKEYDIDFDNKNGKGFSFEIVSLTQEGEDETIYALKNNSDESKHFEYLEMKKGVEAKKIEANIGLENLESKFNIIGNMSYKDQNINKLSLDLNSSLDFSNKKPIDVKFEEKNNVLLNNYESNDIDNIFNNLKGRIIKRLEEKQAVINTKMLNNILVWVDNKQVEKINEEKNNQELIKQRFNNKFILYEGENIEADTLKKLLVVAGKNMKDYQVINGKHIKLLIQSGVKNEEKADKISQVLADNRKKFNIKMEYSEDGYINAIDILVYENN